MTRFFIGIDNGSQSSKVAIYDEYGQVRAQGQVPLQPSHSPRPGIVEHPGDDLWETIAKACRIALAQFDGDVSDIAGIGLCTIRFCRAILRADGSLAQPIQSWMDARVSRPFHVESSDTAYVTTSSGYITYRLTGCRRDTVANYQGVWPVDTDNWSWSTRDADYIHTGMRRDQLFELVQPGEILGTIHAEAAELTGLPEGLPVIATANDKAVEALGAGLREPSTVLLSLGTYIAGMTVGTVNWSDAHSFWTNFGSQPNMYLYECQGIRRGMWTVSWFRDLLRGDGAGEASTLGPHLEATLNREASEVPPGSDGLLTVLDWLAPAEASFRKGSLLGLDSRHGRAHIYRSILESIAMTMKESSDAMARELDTHFDQVLVSGGGASSELMMRIVADVFEIDAIQVSGDSAAGRGAAMCAAVATGVAPSWSAARQNMAANGNRFAPNSANSPMFRQLGTILSTVRKHTDPIYRQTSLTED